MKVTLRIFLMLLLACGFSFAQAQYKVLFNFDGTNGSWPQSLILDQAGNLYGTTAFGGTNSDTDCNSRGCGTLFKLSPNGDGTWTQTVLYDFCAAGPHCQDGYNPNSGLVFDAAGNLYGTTLSGGPYGGGVIFQLSPPAHGGAWGMNLLYFFCPNTTCPDGESPSGALAIDASGNLYGTTASGGNNFHGTVFELSPPSSQGGAWTEAVIYDFCTKTQGKACLDGFDPVGGVTLDNSGNLIGTTGLGGQYQRCSGQGCGTVFKLSPSSGGWTYTLLDATLESAGFAPVAPVVTDSTGDAYGTFQQGGKGNGAVFKISANGQHSSLSLNNAEGANPDAALVLGNNVLYGSTNGFGSFQPGSIFQITSTGQSVLHKFCSEKHCADGVSPLGLVSNSSGTLFGVASNGGAGGSCGGGCGVVFELKP